MSGSGLIVVNAAVRVGYGVAVLVAPSKPVLGRVQLAPATEELPEARLFVRGFASHQIAVGIVGLASLHDRRHRRHGLLLAAATDLADTVSALIEARARGGLDADLREGIVFSGAGFVTALLALRGI